jgi:hypothetical protein
VTVFEMVFDKYKWVSVGRGRNGKTFMVSIFIDHPASNYEEVVGRGSTVEEALQKAEAQLTRSQLDIIYRQFLEMHKEAAE